MSFPKLAALCAALSVPAGALAQPALFSAPLPSEATIVIPAGGLAGQSAEGRAVLDHLVAVAASRLCAEAAGPAFGDAWDACRRDAIRDARQQVQAVMVAADRRVRLASADRR